MWGMRHFFPLVLGWWGIPAEFSFGRNHLDKVAQKEKHTSSRVACSVSSYARMSGLSQSAISQRISRPHNKIEVEKAEIITPVGLKTHNLIWEDTITKWIVRDNPELAETIMLSGVRVFLCSLVGIHIVV